MQNEATPIEGDSDDSQASRDVDERALLYGDGGYGPLDSDDIEWLIESGHYPMPVTPKKPPDDT